MKRWDHNKNYNSHFTGSGLGQKIQNTHHPTKPPSTICGDPQEVTHKQQYSCGVPQSLTSCATLLPSFTRNRTCPLMSPLSKYHHLWSSGGLTRCLSLFLLHYVWGPDRCAICVPIYKAFRSLGLSYTCSNLHGTHPWFRCKDAWAKRQNWGAVTVYYSKRLSHSMSWLQCLFLQGEFSAPMKKGLWWTCPTSL